MRAGLLALTTVAAVAFAPAAANAKTGSIYDITLAKGFERVTFDGTQNGGCDLYNTCGYAGVVTYTFGGTPHGKVMLTRAKNGRVKATARYKTAGVTHVRVTPPDGGATCTDTIAHTTDVFSMSSQGSRFQNLVLNYHPSGADYLDSACPGPNEGAVSDAGVLPRGVFQPKAFFKGNRPRFTLSGGYSFRAAGFSSAIDWKLAYKLKERACSPHCKIR